MCLQQNFRLKFVLPFQQNYLHQTSHFRHLIVSKQIRHQKNQSFAVVIEYFVQVVAQRLFHFVLPPVFKDTRPYTYCNYILKYTACQHEYHNR